VVAPSCPNRELLREAQRRRTIYTRASRRTQAYAGSNGYFYAYYPGSDGAMHIMLWNGTSWQDQDLGGSVAPGSSPSAF
jgi:hypothetical protein